MSSFVTIMKLLIHITIIHMACTQIIDQGNIYCGDSKTNTLPNSTSAHRYSFDVTGIYEIQLSTCPSTDNSMDTKLVIYESDGSTQYYTCDNSEVGTVEKQCSDGTYGGNPCGVNKETIILNLPTSGSYFIDVEDFSDIGGLTYTLEMTCDITFAPTTTYPTTNQPTTATPTTTEPTTTAPTSEPCDVFLKMDMNTIPGQWTQLSTYAAQLVSGSPQCENDGENCWRMGNQVNGYCEYSRIISTIGYQNISLNFHLYESGQESNEYCRIKYALPNDATPTKIFEQHGNVDIHGSKTVTLPYEMSNQNNLTFYLESSANGGTIGDEYCFFDNIYLCGFSVITSSPTTSQPTSIPTTFTPTTISPTTNSPTTNAPTTNAPTTNIPTTISPTTNIPTTVSPSNIPTIFPTNYPSTSNPTTLSPVLDVTPTTAPVRDGEQQNTLSTEQTKVNSNFGASNESDVDMVIIIGIVAALIAFIVIVIAFVCCYRIRTQKRIYAGNNVNKDDMEMVSMESPYMGTNTPNNNAIMRVSSLSDANSDNDILADMNVDIVKNVSDGHGTVTGTNGNMNSMNQNGEGDDGNGTDNELYEGNDNNQSDDNFNTPSGIGITPQTPQYENENENSMKLEDEQEEDNDGMYQKGVKTKQ